MTFYEKLYRSAHATTQQSPLLEPVTLSGYYEASNGYFYSQAWDNGKLISGEIGYSAEFMRADREFSIKHGGHLRDNDGKYQEFIYQALDLDRGFQAEGCICGYLPTDTPGLTQFDWKENCPVHLVQ